MLEKIKAYYLAAKYLPRISYNASLPSFMRILAFFTSQEPINIFFRNNEKITISRNYKFSIRKRKILIEDKENNLVLHIFLYNYQANKYKQNRDTFVQSLKSNNFTAPKYIIISNSSNLNVVIEELVSGVSLDLAKNDILEKFVDIFLDTIQMNTKTSDNIAKEQHTYLELKKTYQRIKKIMGLESFFFKLYYLCDFPFEKDYGVWPVSYCHGQVFPGNIIYNKQSDKYYFIDYETEDIGYGPYAYDYCFFILYGFNYLSSDYRLKLKDIFSVDFKNYQLQKAFLAQIIWWSRNKNLTPDQIIKINKRSQMALSFFNNKK